jgi:hypothetical protein
VANRMLPGTRYFDKSPRAKLFDVSILAADLVGPTHPMPFWVSLSTRPTSKGDSGPMTASSTFWVSAYWTTLSTSVSRANRKSLLARAMPGFLFFMTEHTSALPRTNAFTIACSLPPPPTASTFMIHTSSCLQDPDRKRNRKSSWTSVREMQGPKELWQSCTGLGAGHMQDAPFPYPSVIGLEPINIHIQVGQ